MVEDPNLPKLICDDFAATLDRLQREGARLDVIWPADDPHSAILTRDGARIRLTSRPDAPPPSAVLPEFRPEFVVTRAGADPGEGRAGMRYRDLIPSRLGGRYIASHISIPEGGPVADWVHYHRIAVQLIVVTRGWVRVVYEDQGAPFVMAAGDMVLQPPGIRHRVLESSPGLEVVEIGCPALHETFADHEMELPNGRVDTGRLFEGQRFHHHVAAEAPWVPWHGAEAQVTGMREASGGRIDACIVRPSARPEMEVPPQDGELVFGFVTEGSARLDRDGDKDLSATDAFVIPPTEAWRLTRASADLRLLIVTTAKLEPESGH